MRIFVLLLVWFLFGGVAVQPGPQAQTAPSAEVAAERTWLFDALRTAPSEGAGQAIAQQVWHFWMRQAPDPASGALMERVQERRLEYDYAGAMVLLDELVARAPDWSEAWNQRATVLFFQEKYDRSLDDVEKTLELEPLHFGALAGKAVILMRQGRIELGQLALRQALEIHPWLSERRMLLPEAPGQEL
jgi:tetratricopeptide (TPR) repeat protein